MGSAHEHVGTQATIPETARKRKKREVVGGFKNKGGDGGMKRRDGGPSRSQVCKSPRGLTSCAPAGPLFCLI